MTLGSGGNSTIKFMSETKYILIFAKSACENDAETKKQLVVGVNTVRNSQ
jgi:hypothetical protein